MYITFIFKLPNGPKGYNTYYGKYYNARKQIMVTIVLICLPVLILTILGNMGILPSNLYALLIMIIMLAKMSQIFCAFMTNLLNPKHKLTSGGRRELRF